VGITIDKNIDLTLKGFKEIYDFETAEFKHVKVIHNP
jgi:hypothetical protein